MQTPAFWEALDGVLRNAKEQRTAIMCSESLWWRCHRRLIADAAVLARGIEVMDLFQDGKLVPHSLTEGARLENGVLIYDGAPQFGI